MEDIKKIREKIDEVDKEMTTLFEKRMDLVLEVANYKKEKGLPILNTEREKQVINKNLTYLSNKDYAPYYSLFFNDVMDISKKYQESILEGLKVSYCGEVGAYAYIAASKLYKNANLIAVSSFKKAYENVVKGISDVAILPIENSFAGDVGEVMDLLFQGNLYINNIYDLEINHDLLVNPGTKLEDIKVVYSHPQALSQCQEFIEQHNFSVKEASNTAIAAKELANNKNKDIAVIGSSSNASLYGLEVIKEHINTSRQNTTRFASFARVMNNEKTNAFSLVFTVKNEAGALAKCLDIIGAHSFNMRNVRSRPLKDLLWQYYFFVEIEGDIDSQDAKDMLVALNTFCDKLKVVGKYNI